MTPVTLLAIDPGIRGCGVAFFRDSQLAACAYVRNPVRTGSGADAVVAVACEVAEWRRFASGSKYADEIAIEIPQAYVVGKSKGSANDLIPLAGVAYAAAALVGGHVTSYSPAQWKGQLDKEVVQRRILGATCAEVLASGARTPRPGTARLSEAEYGIADEAVRQAKSLAHNLVDAAGLGLFHLKRFDPVRVFAT